MSALESARSGTEKYRRRTRKNADGIWVEEIGHCDEQDQINITIKWLSDAEDEIEYLRGENTAIRQAALRRRQDDEARIRALERDEQRKNSAQKKNDSARKAQFSALIALAIAAGETAKALQKRAE